mmetsp:Transcript_97912/g.310535  ORF Transcript_97912/g.310535 Transcript_97912/m.310535 type:complete len:717 (-) Transcript_97912:185-2335(-)
MVTADAAEAIAMGAHQPACPDLSKHSASEEELFDPSIQDCAVRLWDALSTMKEMRRQHDQTAHTLEFIATTLDKQGSTCCRVKQLVCPAPAHLEQDTQPGSAEEEGGLCCRPSHAVCPPAEHPAEDTQAWADTGQKKFVRDGDHTSPDPQGDLRAGSRQEFKDRRVSSRASSRGSTRSLPRSSQVLRHPPYTAVQHLHGSVNSHVLESWEGNAYGIGTSVFASKVRRSIHTSQEVERSIRFSSTGGSNVRCSRSAEVEEAVENAIRNSEQLVRHAPTSSQRLQQLLQGTTEFEPNHVPHPMGPYGTALHRAEKLLGTQRIECIIGLVILANSICIGVETQQDLTGVSDPAFEALEHAFLAFYVVEVGIRLLAGGKACFWDPWFNFDLLLVLGGCSASWVLKPIYRSTGGPQSQDREVLSQLMIFRICRLLRMLRAMRMVKKFRSMWRLVYGLFASFNTMISTLSLVALVLYTFACLGVELITMDPNLSESASPEVRRVVDTFFKDLIVTQMFLFQFVTLDSVAAVYMPLIKEKPILALYFLTVLLVVSISLMNLVMAKIVEGALDAAHHDHEMERQQRKESIRAIVPVLKDIFARMDQDGSGHVELRELQVLGMTQVPEELAPLVMMDSMVELFEILDVDNSGTVSQDEFIEGILNMHISEVPLQQMQMLQMIRALRDNVCKIEAHLSTARTATASEQNEPCPSASRTQEKKMDYV